MRRSTGPRKTAKLSDSTQQWLNMYALAAGAAGVGMLAVAQPAAAKIVYTPANINLGFSQVTPLDLNHDGITDFNFYATYSESSGGGGNGFLVRLAQRQNAIVGYASHSHRGFSASALRPGARVGKARAFVTDALMGWAESRNRHEYFRGPWANGGKGVKNRYLGLKFFVKGKLHYGWARLNVFKNGCCLQGTLTGYAYETIPGKSIIAGATKGPDDDSQPFPAAHASPTPKPATLGVLALGAPGLSIWRREDPVAATSDRS